MLWLHQLGNVVKSLSGRFSYGGTMILEVLRGNGPSLTAVASQLTKMVQKLEHDDALTWSINLSSNFARQRYLAI